MTTPPEKLIGYVFQLVTSLGENQQLTLSGNFEHGAPKEAMGQEFDKLLAVTDRLAAKHKIAAKRALIASKEFQVAALTEDLNQLDESKKGLAMNQAEKQNREVMKRNIRFLGSEIEGFKKDLEGLIKEAE